MGPVAELAADFGPRLNVLTGDNGVGKSFLPISFWVLTGSWPGGRVAMPDPNGKRRQPRIEYDVQSKTKEAHRTARYDVKTQTWSRQAGRPPMPGLVIYAAVDVVSPCGTRPGITPEGPAGRVERGEQPRRKFPPRTFSTAWGAGRDALRGTGPGLGALVLPGYVPCTRTERRGTSPISLLCRSSRDWPTLRNRCSWANHAGCSWTRPRTTPRCRCPTD